MFWHRRSFRFFLPLLLSVLGVLPVRAGDQENEIVQLWNAKEHRKAERELEAWMEKEPKSAAPWVTAARLRFEEKRFKKCVSLGQAALKRSPQSADAYYWRGRAYEAMNQPLEAANEYRAALLADKDHAEARAGLDRASSLLGHSTADARDDGEFTDH